MEKRRGRSVGTIISAATVLAIVAVLGVFAVVFDDADDAVPTTKPAEELVAAYARSRSGTYVVEAEFSRTMADGRRLESAGLTAQRPPDELRRQLGSASGRLGDRSLNCTPGTSGPMQCAASGAVAPWAEMVDTEVANLQSYFDGEVPLYRAERLDPGCYRIHQVAAVPDAPYGRTATFCFDATTGAMSRLELRREGGSVDVLEAVNIRNEVTEADFSLDAPEVFEPRPA